MAYQFAGFFAKPQTGRPDILPVNAVWRRIDRPFEGVGVLLPDLIGRAIDPPRVEALAERLGLREAEDWLFIAYDCWAGQVDFVYGLGLRGEHRFGPIEEDRLSETETAYLDLMEEFGVRPEDASAFPPFERGFWGET